MSAQPSSSQQPGIATDVDETRLPSGQCRYILLNPEIKGHRCGCVGFTLNRALPGVACECGHLSCYHIKGAELPPDSVQLDRLQRRIQALEDQLDRETEGGFGSTLGGLLRRLGDLEEQVEKSKEDFTHENRDIYGQITRVWHTVDQIRKQQGETLDRISTFGERLDEHNDSVQRLSNRLMEADDAAIDLEERIDRLEDITTVDAHKLTEPTDSDATTLDAATRLPLPQGFGFREGDIPASIVPNGAERPKPNLSTRETLAEKDAPWTVHVSLMPMASLAFPFEKDTNAYKRCLSRGLHQMIAVQGSDSSSFINAVSAAFGSLLKGRPWMPLQARLCEAETLLGLPMLRRLDSTLIDINNYNKDFLIQNCGVCGPNGKLDSLYIAMEYDTFSWHFLRRLPCFMQGLEDSWAPDPLLDYNDPFEDDSLDEESRPSAGDFLPSLPCLKRTASEMTRTQSFSSGSTAEGEGSRPKVARTGTCVPVPLELRRRVETV
ncbi:hypothetical protein BX600DRAFT_97063 [Xylariales sp. PMI_506]|nr:hypothetical protein BX600DRAFT_97063 [Xylariales sp. PMI_506]